MGEKKLYWLKLMNDFFTQPKIKKLRRIAGGDTYTIIYLKLQLLSLTSDAKLFFEGIEDDFVEEIALKIDEDVDNVRVTLNYLKAQGLLEEIEGDSEEYLLPETSILIGSETASAGRQRKSRSARKSLRQCDNVTPLSQPCHIEIEIEKEIESDIETIEKPKRKGFDIADHLKTQGIISPVLEEAVGGWLEMRKSNKAPVTDRGIKMAIGQALRFADNDPAKASKIFDQSTMNGWKGVFPLHEDRQSGGSQGYNRGPSRNTDWGTERNEDAEAF